MTSITVGSIVLNEKLDDSTDYKGFYFNKLTDWYTLPQSKAGNTPRPNAHGSFGGGNDWRESAIPSVAGGFLGVDEADALAAMDELKMAWAQGSQVDFVVADSLRATRRSVSVRFLTIPDHRGRPRFEFTLDTLARDPRRYGSVVTAQNGLPVLTGGLTWPITWDITWAAGGNDGRITLANPGTAESSPLLEVTGGLSGGFSITEVGTAREVRFERLIPDGSTIFLNPATSQAYIDAPGNDVSGFLTRSEWPSAPPQGQTILQFNALGVVTGTPTLTGRLAPAYL